MDSCGPTWVGYRWVCKEDQGRIHLLRLGTLGTVHEWFHSVELKYLKFKHIYFELFALFKRPDIWFNHLDVWILCIKLYTKRCIYYLHHATMVRLKNPFPCWHLLCFLINWGEGGEFHTVAEVWSVDAARALGVSERVWNRVCSIAMLGASKITDLFQWCSKGDFWQTCANPAFFALQSTFDI